MSVLIKGMEMPKSCHCCRMCVQVADGDIDWHWECCLLCEKVARYATDRIPGCPLVPVQPHGDLIDRDEIPYKKIMLDDDDEFYYGVTQPYIDRMPAVIEAEEGE